LYQQLTDLTTAINALSANDKYLLDLTNYNKLLASYNEYVNSSTEVPVDPPEVVPDDNTQKSVNILWIVLPSVLGAVVVAAVVAVVVIVKKRRGVR
jgi:hypothetical protein